MNHFSKILCLCLVFGFWQSVKAQSKLNKLEGKIEGLRNGKVVLANYFGDKQYIKDSLFTDLNGKISKTFKEPIPAGIYLLVINSNTYFEFIVNKDPSIVFETDISDINEKLVFKTSPENQRFLAYQKKMAEFSKMSAPFNQLFMDSNSVETTKEHAKSELIEIDSMVKITKENYLKDYPNDFFAKILALTIEPDVNPADFTKNGKTDSVALFSTFKYSYWSNIDFEEDGLIRTPVYFAKLKKWMTELTIQDPDSIIAAADYILARVKPKTDMYKFTLYWITSYYEKSNYMGHDKIFVHMYDNYYKTGKAFWIDETALARFKSRAEQIRPNLIGEIGVNLNLPDVNNKYQQLYKTGTPYTILYFWDPNCGLCQKSTPKLKTFYEKYKNRGVEVYAVCVEKEEEAWKKYVKDNALPWINVADLRNESPMRLFYDINSTPLIYVLDPNHKIVAKRIGVEALDEIMDRLLVMPR